MSRVELLVVSYSVNEDKKKLLIRGRPQIQPVCYSRLWPLSWKHPAPPPTAALLKLFDIPLERIFPFRHLLLSKETLTILKCAATLLENMKAYSRTTSSHIMVKHVLTNHKRGLLALKICPVYMII